MRYRKSISSVGLVAALALVLGACGGGSSGSAATNPSGDAPATGSGIPQVASPNASGDAPATESGIPQVAATAYGDLPFTDTLPMDQGEIKIDGKTPKIVIGFSQTGFNHPWRVAMLQSVQAEVARHPNVSLVVTDGHVDIAKQSNDIDDLLARGVDAIIMSPVESAGLVPAANRVLAAGIPLVVLDRDVFTDKSLFIGQSNVTMAYEVAKQMVKALGGKGKIVEITGLVGSSPAIDRSKGLKMALQEAPGIELLATGDGEWIREPAVALMEDWLVRFPHIDAVFSHAEESSWGAQLAISKADRCGDRTLQFTHDGSSPGFQSVADGQFSADGNYSPFIGDIGVRAALTLLQGQKIPDAKAYDQPGSYLQLPDSEVVTPDNAAKWIPRGWGDFAPPPNPCAK